MKSTNKTTWVIDPAHTEIQFKVRHLVIATVTGQFEKFEGSVVAGSEDFSDAEVTFSADIDSVNTKVPDRDAHLKSPDFFDAANFPKLYFKSTRIRKTGKTTYKLTGDLAIRGVTKAVTMDVSFGGTIVDPWGNTKAGFELNGIVNRMDYGLAWNAMTEAGNLVAAEEVKILANVELVKQ